MTTAATAAAPDTSAAAPPPPAPAPAPVAAPPPVPAGDPDWLPDRLNRAAEAARAALLKQLGVDDPAKAKAALDAAKAAEDAQKTQAERDAARIAELSKASARVADLEAIAKGRAEYEFAKLSDTQKTAVTSLAGDDPAAQLRAITALAPTWGAAAAPAPPPAAVPVPAASAPNAPAPPPAPTSGPDHKARYAELQRDNPVAAAHYLTAHQREIYPAP